MKKNYIIPFFILHEGCPNKCIYCDQNKITGQRKTDPDELRSQIENHLDTIPETAESIEIGFFGGTFTALPLKEQENYLKIAYTFVKERKINGIRLSTRPDCINPENLKLLKRFGVSCIELGVQSISDKVLTYIKRGYSSQDVVNSSEMILNEGFDLGHQIMVGLPMSSLKEEYDTAKWVKKIGATQVRIYPVIVIENTDLAVLYKEGKYQVLTEEEAIKRCMKLLIYFEANDIKVIRCGLHPSEGLISGKNYLAGPFHASFRQKVDSAIFCQLLEKVISKPIVEICYNPLDEAAFFGHKSGNRAVIDRISQNRKVSISSDSDVPRGNLKIKESEKQYILKREELQVDKD